MKSVKYNYNKSQQSFVDTISQQSRFCRNTHIPSTHRYPIPMKDNTFSTNMEGSNYARNGANGQNIGHFYLHPQQSNTGISNHTNSSRQRFAPYPPFKRSYAHALMQPMNIRYLNYQSQMQQTTASPNHVNIMDHQSSFIMPPNDSTYR